MKKTGFQLRLWILLLAIALVALDIAFVIHAPAPIAFVALVVTVASVVLLAIRAVARCGNKGPGKTLY